MACGSFSEIARAFAEARHTTACRRTHRSMHLVPADGTPQPEAHTGSTGDRTSWLTSCV